MQGAPWFVRFNFLGVPPDHAREPLYSKFAVVAGRLQSTSAEFGHFFVYRDIKKRYLSLNIFLLEVFFADYRHLYVQLHACLTRDVS